ncbi:JAB domain-containing protein [Rhizorhapis suberifaciens]|uniref:DNA repair protein RadC n=1 Tax=Rhizorhapis suberifaciens TaxID=13656 RepID=A0A840HWN2_9SPHN|nr:JAB domain-containing protein [Rhizorhapis suberifaciens]MBB4641876.1 DNA repair protein RadC [Rhizorhapis suberifaciens]
MTEQTSFAHLTAPPEIRVDRQPQAEAIFPAISPLEYLLVLYVDADGKIAQVHCNTDFLKDMVLLPARSIVREALVHGHRRFILMHNHPSGDPSPSPADIVVTRLLCRTAATLGLELLDHIIVAQQSCFSFRAAGLM